MTMVTLFLRWFCFTSTICILFHVTCANEDLPQETQNIEDHSKIPFQTTTNFHPNKDTTHDNMESNSPTTTSSILSTDPKTTEIVSIDHVEAHLHILQQLEESVAQSISKMNARAENEKHRSWSKRRSSEAIRLSKELELVQQNLQQLAEGLNGTLEALEDVEKDTEKQSEKLRSILELQEEEKQVKFLQENGVQMVDYETGLLKNSSHLKYNSSQVRNREIVEKNSDPAVLHYDFHLLGQIAMLLGVSALGGILSTYWNAPPHVGYLLGGALVGPSGFNFVNQLKEVETISLFGSIFLLFGHGAGYSLQTPDRDFKRFIIGGVMYISTTAILVALFSFNINWSSTFIEGLIIGIGVCFTTTAPLYERIRENGLQDSSYGRTVTAIILVQDCLMSFALGSPEWFSSSSFAWISFAAMRSIISYVFVLSLAYNMHVHLIPRLLEFLSNMEQAHKSPLVLLGVITVCLFMALVTEELGLSLECGAFLAGLSFVKPSSRSSSSGQTTYVAPTSSFHAAFSSIRVLENVFGSMFFACVGMILNPWFLIRNLGEIMSMVLIIWFIKSVVLTSVMFFFQISFKKTLVASMGLCQVGELALIFMIKARAQKLISRRTYLLFITATAIFLGFSSVFNRQVILTKKKSSYRVPSMLPHGRMKSDSIN